MMHRGLRSGVVMMVLGLLLTWAVAGSTVAASLASSAQPGPDPSAPAATSGGPTAPIQHPNIVFILTDDLDQNLGGLDARYLPRIKALLTDQGTTFANHFVSLSLCCPSRSTTLRGQYAHNTQIFTNDASTHGGFETFHANGEENSTIATWLQAAGYRTVLMGKYLNGYPDGVAHTYIPPGWSEWYSPAAGDPYGEYNYTLNENGHLVPYDSVYMVDVLSSKAQGFIQRASRNHTPFFMYVAPYAPHQPATPAGRYMNDFQNVPLPQPPSFNEANVSDKPAWMSQRPLLGRTQIDDLTRLYRNRLRSMEAVEDLVQTVINTLRATGELDHTYIFFASDNGFHLGEHRLPAGKNTVYEEDLKVPLIVRGPGVAARRTIQAFTANVDYAPTFAALAGVQPPAFVDGRSLVPLLLDQSPPDWRAGLLLEHAAPVTAPVATTGETGMDSALLEPPDPMDLSIQAANGKFDIPPYVGVRTADLAFAQYETGDRELYCLGSDPYELSNVAATPANAALVSALATWSRDLAQCAGATCRTLEAQLPAHLPACHP
ncbi:MAG: sulfatase [Anaerolineae bacterium]|nr:sulfatase [Anaerolineae bacterium]